MKGLNEFIYKYGLHILIGFCLLSYVKSCNISSELKKVKKENKLIQAEIDTLTTQIVSEDKMVKIIKTTPAWKTLRLEEISDKEKISINALEEKEK